MAQMDVMLSGPTSIKLTKMH